MNACQAGWLGWLADWSVFLASKEKVTFYVLKTPATSVCNFNKQKWTQKKKNTTENETKMFKTSAKQ